MNYRLLVAGVFWAEYGYISQRVVELLGSAKIALPTNPATQLRKKFLLLMWQNHFMGVNKVCINIRLTVSVKVRVVVVVGFSKRPQCAGFHTKTCVSVRVAIRVSLVWLVSGNSLVALCKHLVNEIADLHLVIISDLAIVMSGPLSSDRRSGTSTDLLAKQVACSGICDSWASCTMYEYIQLNMTYLKSAFIYWWLSIRNAKIQINISIWLVRHTATSHDADVWDRSAYFVVRIIRRQHTVTLQIRRTLWRQPWRPWLVGARSPLLSRLYPLWLTLDRIVRVPLTPRKLVRRFKQQNNSYDIRK